MLTVVHCTDPLAPGEVDANFAGEAAVALSHGLPSVRIDHDALVAGDMRGALRGLRDPVPGPAVYRGWMMHAEAYGRLHAALAARGVALMTPPKAYAACHHYLEAHACLGDLMPESTFVPGELATDRTAVAGALRGFGAAPVTLKDWVKSQASGYWDTACMIPDASDTDTAMRVVSRFLDLQGRDFAGGLVFRRLLDLEASGGETREWRMFVVDGVVVGRWPRHRDGSGEAPPDTLSGGIAVRVGSPFASVDMVRGTDGRWWVMETGDGQVSGLPEGSAPAVLSALAAMAAKRGRSA